MRNASLSRADFAGIVIGAVLLGIWGLGFWARSVSKRRQDECPYNLRLIQLAYLTHIADGSSIVSHPQSIESTNGKVLTAATIFSTFYPTEHGSRNLVCPKDSRTVVQPRKPLGDENLSYFISISEIQHDPKALLTGGRNLFPGPGIHRVQARTNWTWNASMGLHGTNGYVGLVDGSVSFYQNVDYTPHDEANQGNVILSP